MDLLFCTRSSTGNSGKCYFTAATKIRGSRVKSKVAKLKESFLFGSNLKNWSFFAKEDLAEILQELGKSYQKLLRLRTKRLAPLVNRALMSINLM